MSCNTKKAKILVIADARNVVNVPVKFKKETGSVSQPLTGVTACRLEIYRQGRELIGTFPGVLPEGGEIWQITLPAGRLLAFRPQILEAALIYIRSGQTQYTTLYIDLK